MKKNKFFRSKPKTKKSGNQNGITLIALVITIIVLLILAGISITMLTGDNNILKQASKAKNEQISASEKELIAIGYNAYIIEKNTNTNAELKVQDASAEGNEENGWTITFTETGNVYMLDKQGNIEKQEDHTEEEMGKIQSGYNKYVADRGVIIAEIEQKQKEALNNVNQTDLDLLRQYCIGNNDKDLLQDILNTESESITFKNREPIPNASEELTFINVEEPKENDIKEIYVYFSYNGNTYKLTSEVQENENNDEAMRWPTKKVEPAVDTSELESQLSNVKLAVEGATANGENGWIITFADTGNKYRMNSEGTTTKMSDLDVLKAYFLGVNKDGSLGTGQDIRDIAYLGNSRQGDRNKIPVKYVNNDIINDASTSVVALDVYVGNSKSCVYVKYKNKAYRVTMQGKPTNVELIYAPKGDEGTKRTYKGEQWTILYDKGDTLELVSPKIIGNYTLGENDPNAVGDYSSDKAIDSFNNAVTRLNTYCRTTLGDNTARCVGSNPETPDDNETNYYSSTDTNKNDWMSTPDIIKAGDDNAEQDYVRLCYWGEITSADDEIYWFASRRVSETNTNIWCYVQDNMYIEGGGRKQLYIING